MILRVLLGWIPALAAVTIAAAQPLTIPVRIMCDTTDPAMSALKVEAGLSLALHRSGRYTYMPADIRDSLLRESSTADVPALEGAALLKAEYVVFASSMRIANLVRSEIVLRSVRDTMVVRRGTGFATSRYTTDGIVLADPAILTSMERALAELDHDTAVVAAPLMSVGGFTFTDDSLATPAWEYFAQPTVNSYHLALSVVYALQNEVTWTVIDLDTRDAMMAKAGLFEVENDRLPTPTEIRILHAFGMDYVVSGSVRRTPTAAEITVVLSAVESGGMLTLVAEHREYVGTDAPEAFAAALATALRSVTAARPQAR